MPAMPMYIARSPRFIAPIRASMPLISPLARAYETSSAPPMDTMASQKPSG